MTQDNFSFSGYQVFPIRNKVVLGNTTFKLEPKVMDVFCLLVNQQGKVLSRNEIAEQLWPEKVVGLDVITRAIFELRKLLNDDPKAPKYIETVARKGYCFLESVSIEWIEPNLSAVNTAKKPKNTASLLALFGVVAALVTWYLQSLSPAGNDSVPAYSQTVLTHQKQLVDDPAISANGKQVSYLEVSNESPTSKTLVAITPEYFGKKVMHELAGNYKSPIISPIHNRLFYIDCVNPRCQLIAVDLETKVRVTHSNIPETLYALTMDKSSETLAINYREGATTKIGLFNIKTSQFQPLTLPRGRYTIPAFNNDGSGFWLATLEANFASKLYFFSLKTNQMNLFGESFHVIQSIAVGKNGHLWIAGKKAGKSGIWYVDTKQQKPINAVTFIGQFPSDMSTSADGSQLVFRLTKRNTKIENWGLPATFSGLNGSAIDIRATYNPTTESVYWISNRTGSFELWQGFDGINTKLTDFKANSLKQPILSPDGNTLAVLEKGARFAKLHILDLRLNTLKRSIVWPYSTNPISWSTDGNGVLFNHNGSLSKLHFVDDTVESLPVKATSFAQNEGEALVVFDKASRALMAHTDSGVKTLIDLADFNAQPETFHLTPESLFFINYADKRLHLMKHDRKTASTSTLFVLPPNSVATEVGLNPQPYVVYDRLHQDETEIVMWTFN